MSKIGTSLLEMLEPKQDTKYTRADFNVKNSFLARFAHGNSKLSKRPCLTTNENRNIVFNHIVNTSFNRDQSVLCNIKF